MVVNSDSDRGCNIVGCCTSVVRVDGCAFDLVADAQLSSICCCYFGDGGGEPDLANSRCEARPHLKTGVTWNRACRATQITYLSELQLVAEWCCLVRRTESPSAEY